MNPLNLGLEGLIVAETRLSQVDGARGALRIAGQPVERLAASAGFEQASAQLWQEAGLGAPEDLALALGEARARASARLPQVSAALDLPEPMSALRASLEGLAPRTPVEILGALAVAVGARVRRQAGAPPLPSDPGAPHAADLLRMALGERPEACAEALDAYLVTVMDHGLNASTFTARVVASTGASDLACVSAAIGALSGPLHGGAPGPVLDMLDAIGVAENARPWLEAELAAGRRIMGMGHRVYRVRDPRAAVLEAAARRLQAAGVGGERLTLARVVEVEAEALLAARHPDRPLKANVEFATAALLEALGLPREAFSLVFACGRAAGWLGHVAEQRRDGRLMRPKARYIGRAA
ncbi:MAG: citrate synthase [Alphaproteobacteria bacterium]|nr:citrate synthase [Alphaproteobacteria bacterium]MCB9792977.1 citrate synthase [Alphaproteobacteria bacterium]